jgi:hypothetical protein
MSDWKEGLRLLNLITSEWFPTIQERETRMEQKLDRMQKLIDALIRTCVPLTEPEEPEEDWLTGTVTPEMRKKIVEEQRKRVEATNPLMRSCGGVPMQEFLSKT